MLQVVASALGAAEHRRSRLSAVTNATTPATTPDSVARVGVKRNLKADRNPASASTAASSSKSNVEKVTPDAKHVRTGGAPTPKALFVSPTADSDVIMEVDQGVVLNNSYLNFNFVCSFID